MKIASFSLLLVSLLLPGLAFGSDGVAMEKHRVLNQKQESIITIAAFTANGDMPRLKTALNEGLDAGLTVNEIKEILVQMYAYAGFPRSLNGLGAFMAVLDERQTKGIKDVTGKDASPIPADLNRDEYGAKVRAQLGGLDKVPQPARWQEFSPVIDRFLKEHLFADIFVRDVLTFQERELATIAALASMPGLEGPLSFHLGAAMNTGLTQEQMKAFVSVIKARVGSKEADSASKFLRDLLANRTAK
ncbi:carboxymuconolactone decarboxylase family protein [Geotalea uraniireducens]|nr:carboxymuconolactone decarboxylase family protein [Geotalea uraniireducens]